MDIKNEIYKTIESSNLTDVGDYSYSSSIEEVADILENTTVEVLIAHNECRQLGVLADLIKGKSTRMLVVGCQGLEAGVNLLCGNCTSSWHQAIPLELKTYS